METAHPPHWLLWGSSHFNLTGQEFPWSSPFLKENPLPRMAQAYDFPIKMGLSNKFL